MIVVADASPLVALATCDTLEILDKLFGEIKVSQAVWDEVTISNKPGSDKLTQYLQDKVYPFDLSDFIIGGHMLDMGELTAIALYKKLSANYLLIDEKAGRRVAKANSIKIIGSLGVLIMAQQKGLITSIKPYIDILRASKVHFSDQLLNDVLLKVGES